MWCNPQNQKPMGPQEGDVAFVHALAKFKCERCGGWCNRLTTARVGEDGKIYSPAEKPSGEIVCNDCTKADSDKAELEHKAHRKRRAWVARNAKHSTTKKGA